MIKKKVNSLFSNQNVNIKSYYPPINIYVLVFLLSPIFLNSIIKDKVNA